MNAASNTLQSTPIKPRLLEAFNPATGAKIGEVCATNVDDIPAIMAGARAAQPAWEALGVKGRLKVMRKFKEVFYFKRDRINGVVMEEQGKLPFEALSQEFWPSIEMISYYLRTAEETLRPRPVFSLLLAFRYHQIEYRAHGVVLIISPWNFPFYLTVPAIMAALIAGNTVLFKPSEFAVLSGELLANMLWEAGVPRDVFQIIHGTGEVAAAAIKAKPNKIAFTGSVSTGRKVAAAAAEHLIPVTLELGGKDATIVLEDADLDRAAKGVTFGSMANAGQACASVERVYVMRSVMDSFVQKLAKEITEHVRVRTQDGSLCLAPMTTAMQLKIVESQVQEALAQGAQAVIGGRVIENGGGRFYEPTILTDLKPAMRVLTDETFGPVVSIVPVDSEEEAVQLANGTGYGLLGSVWTRDRARGLRIARQLKAGHAGVNDHIISANLPALPWGGVGETGYGRTRGKEGLLEMTTTQGISVDLVPISISEMLIWYPHTQLKQNLLMRIIAFMQGPTIKEQIKALTGKF
ncbi:MAG: aldehyde dehydrogenase family protein [Anaerolineae bacterium]|nr:aldehyde dehydrogenase family protein [Anaerolineae bacterium]